MAKRPYRAVSEGNDAASDPGGTPRGIEPFVLLRLARAPAHGYELAQTVAELGFRRVARDRSILYKVLRALEEEGCTTSHWETSDAGPARRIYRLTERGETYLAARAEDLERQKRRIDRFLEQYRKTKRGSTSRGKEQPPWARKRKTRTSIGARS